MENFLATLFLSRDLAHSDHWRTGSYAQHMALGSFYDAIIPLADTLAEAYMGRGNDLAPIPLLDDEEKATPFETLTAHLKIVEDSRYKAVSKTDTALQNIIDEIVGEYLSVLYKLRKLK
jgi:hypothetical protein